MTNGNSNREMAARIREFQWSRTSLGPIEQWPVSLRVASAMVLDNRFPMTMWWGPDLLHIYNDAYIPVLSGKHPHALGRPAAEVWNEIWHILGPQCDFVTNGNGATWNEHLLLPMNRKGFLEETYFTFSYSPLRDDHGGIGGVLVTCQETTAHVQSERQLRMLRDLGAHAAVDSAEEVCQIVAKILAQNSTDLPFAMIHLVNDGEPQWFPAAIAPQADGATTAALRGHSWPFDDALAAGGVLIIENLPDRIGPPYVAYDQRPIERAIILALTRAGSASPHGFLVAGLNPLRPLDERYREFFRLTSEQIAAAIANARAYEEERKRAEDLAALDRAKTAFFSNVSHEFRTPLTLMLGPVESLLDHAGAVPADELHQQLEIVHRNSLRLLKLVNTMLDFARIEEGHAHALFQPVDLAARTAELAGMFRSAIENAGLRLIVDCPSLDEPVYVDPDMWEKIILNLLSNAFKFTIEGEIEVAMRSANGHVEVAVRDTGLGIPPHEIHHVFDRFHRVDDTRGRTHEGTGIGLALVRELVTLHGGEIRVESTLDAGSRFIVTLPLGVSHIHPDRIVTNQPESSTRTRADTFVQEALGWMGKPSTDVPDRDSRPSDESRPRVVLADDNADMREYVMRVLGGRFDIEAVADGQAALEAARANPPDLVLSDVMMPRLDGCALIREMRRDPVLRDIPIILVSARAGEEARIHGMQIGADDYLVKPFSPRELVARVHTNVRMARLRAAMSRALTESERRLATLVANLPGPAFRANNDRKWTVEFISKGVYELTGYTSDDFNSGRVSWSDMVHPDDFDRTWATVQEALRNHRPYEIEYRVCHRNGDVRWAWARGEGIFRHDGTLEALEGFVTDITDRKRAEELLRDSEGRYRGVVESQAEMICRFRADGTILFANESYARSYGASTDTLVGANLWKSVTENDRPKVQQLLDKLTPDAPEIHIENRVETPTGTRWTLWTNRALDFDEHGRMTEAQATGIDITARKELEEAQLRAKKELEARVAERTDELERQNLRLRQLAHQLTDTEQRERRQLAQTLHDGLQQILVAAKMQLPLCVGGDAPSAVERVRELIDEAVKTSRSLSYELSPPALHSSPLPEALEWLVRWIDTNYNFRVSLNTADDFPPLSDQTKTFAFNAVRELLLNSVKHSGATGATLSLRARTGEVILTIADDGHGFDPADLERHDNARGFGLFSMRERLAALGGKLRIDSAPGNGACFEVVMPADGSDAIHATAVLTKKAQRALRGPISAGGPVRVMIADDHGIFREGLTSLLEGHDDIELVGEARDGVEAVSRADELRPHVIIMDVNMPRMNGIEATRQIKRKHPAVSVIGLSFYEEKEMADAMRRAGASAYLAKGGVADMLLNTIRQLKIEENV